MDIFDVSRRLDSIWRCVLAAGHGSGPAGQGTLLGVLLFAAALKIEPRLGIDHHRGDRVYPHSGIDRGQAG